MIFLLTSGIQNIFFFYRGVCFIVDLKRLIIIIWYFIQILPFKNSFHLHYHYHLHHLKSLLFSILVMYIDIWSELSSIFGLLFQRQIFLTSLVSSNKSQALHHPRPFPLDVPQSSNINLCRSEINMLGETLWWVLGIAELFCFWNKMIFDA